MITKAVPHYADLIHNVMDFSGGLNTRSSTLFLSGDARYALRPNQLTVLDNMLRTASGTLTTRPGRVKLNQTPVTPPSGDQVIRSIYELRFANNTGQVVINAGNSVYRWDPATSSFVSVGTMPTANTRIIWTQFADILIGVNGVDAPVKYDGVSLSALGGNPPTNPTVVASFRNRVWMIQGQTLYYSALGNPNDWTTPNNAGSLPIPVTRGQGGTGLIPMWERLIILCNSQVFQLMGTGPSDFRIGAINLQFGHEGNPYAYTPVGNDVYFISRGGVHGLSIALAQSETGDVQYDYISGKIEPTWQDITPSNIPNIVAVPDTMRNLVLFLCNQSGTLNDQALVADYYHLDEFGKPTWSRYTNFPFASGAQVNLLSSTKEVLFGGYNGFVYRQTDDATDDGVAIPTNVSYVTDLGAAQFTKLFRHLVIFANAHSGELTVSGTIDFGGSVIKSRTVDISSKGGDIIGQTFTIGVSALGSTNFRQLTIPIPGHGRFLTLNFNATNTTKTTIGGFIITAGLRRLLHVH